MKANLVSKSKTIVFIAIVLVILTGCAERFQASVLPTEGDSNTPVTPTSEIMPSSQSTTSTPPQTDSPQMTATLEPPSFEVPLSSYSSNSGYQLVTPSAEEYIRLLQLMEIQDDYYWSKEVGLTPLSQVLEEDLGMFHSMLFREFSSFHARVEDAYDLYKLAYPDISISGLMFQNLSEQAFLDYLNTEDVILVDGETAESEYFIWKPFQVQLDSDREPEWLVEFENGGLTFLVLDYTDDEYELVDWFLYKGYRGNKEFEILDLRDQNGDGFSDLLILEHDYFWGTISLNVVFAYGMNQAFSIETDDLYRVMSYSGIPEGFYDPNLRELTIELDNADPWFCNWETRIIYRWYQATEPISTTGEDPPGTSGCLLTQATFPESDLSINESIYLLREVIRGYQNSPPRDIDYLAFARYRLAILHAIRGEQAYVREQLAKLIELEQSDSEAAASLKDPINTLLGREHISPADLCYMTFIPVITEKSQISSTWADELSYASLFEAYAITEPYPAGFCSISDVVTHAAEIANFDSTEDPTEFLQSLGLEIQHSFSFQADSSLPPSWIFLIMNDNPQILEYKPSADRTDRWRVLHDFVPSSLEYEWLHEDVTGDGRVDLAIVFDSEHKRVICGIEEKKISIFFASRTLDPRRSSIGTHTCMSEDIKLTDFLSDIDGDGISDFLQQYYSPQIEDSLQLESATVPIIDFSQFLKADERDTPDSLDEIDSLARFVYFVLNSEHPYEYQPAIRELLIAYRDHPYSYYPLSALRYLLARTYELEGDTCTAVQHYLTVIQNNPATLWSQLAAAHIKPEAGSTNSCP